MLCWRARPMWAAVEQEVGRPASCQCSSGAASLQPCLGIPSGVTVLGLCYRAVLSRQQYLAEQMRRRRVRLPVMMWLARCVLASTRGAASMLLCDVCDRQQGLHMKCIGRRRRRTPAGDWYSSDCPPPSPGNTLNRCRRGTPRPHGYRTLNVPRVPHPKCNNRCWLARTWATAAQSASTPAGPLKATASRCLRMVGGGGPRSSRQQQRGTTGARWQLQHWMYCWQQCWPRPTPPLPALRGSCVRAAAARGCCQLRCGRLLTGCAQR
jgi:hypothetical protein